MTDLQKASISKRISAFLFDIILVSILVAAIATILSWALGFNGYMNTWDERTAYYEEAYGVKFDMTVDEYDSLTDAQKEAYQSGLEALWQDESAAHAYQMLFSLSFVILTFSVLISIGLWEFVLPLYFKNGQTLGKKIFGIALMRTDGVRVSTFSLFVRAILGKYTVETMVPILMILMLLFNAIGAVGLFVLLGILVLQIVLMITSHTNSMIHDVFAVTVVVDYHSQKIFDSTEDMIAYKQRIHAEQVSKKEY